MQLSQTSLITPDSSSIWKRILVWWKTSRNTRVQWKKEKIARVQGTFLIQPKMTVTYKYHRLPQLPQSVATKAIVRLAGQITKSHQEPARPQARLKQWRKPRRLSIWITSLRATLVGPLARWSAADPIRLQQVKVTHNLMKTIQKCYFFQMTKWQSLTFGSLIHSPRYQVFSSNCSI